MPSLQAAHRGYEYQDLLSASRLVDLVLGTVSAAYVDVKQVGDDRFDDLTIVTTDGRRERTQFKHTDNDDKPLAVETFTTDGRDLRIDRLVAAAVADRDGPGSSAADLAFRVVLRDTGPVHEALTAVMVLADPDPGPFVAGMRTQRLRFDVDRLWPLELPQEVATGAGRDRFAFLRSGPKAVDRGDLAWLCARLVIEVEAPRSSGIMVDPGPAERILLTRVRAEIGAESYPNAGRSAEDVAEAFATFARQARQGISMPTAAGMLQRAQLRRDFGAVSRAHPVDRSLEVARPRTVADIQTAAQRAASEGVPLVLTGSPGQGKSWACDQLVRDLISARWLVAEHYCYLNDTHDERDERVQAETVFGSLLGRLAEADPSLVDSQRPRYAADDVALTNAVSRSVQFNPDRQVALIVDGLDHIARIAPTRPGTDPSAAVAAALAALDIPAGSVLVVLSQPGEHLVPLQNAGAHVVEIPTLTGAELGALAANLGLVSGPETINPIVEEQQADGFLSALGERSRGNALYATYLCREIMARPDAEADPEAVLRALPPFDGTLENYYTHLAAVLGPGLGVADVVGLLDFPVSRAELAEIRPDLAHWLDDALATLAPVLAERATQGGLRVYHESFARFLRRRMEATPGVLTANIRFVVEWLDARGFYRDERAFRFLLPMLAAVGRDSEVLDLVDVDFAFNAIAGGHPASAIAANLAVATSCAGREGNLPALSRCVELARAAESFEDERLDSVAVDYIDVPMALLGREEFASRLMFDGKIAVPARAGIQLCAAIDAAGVVAPWRDYLPAFAKWQESNTTDYGSESSRAVALSWVRGQLRQVSTGATPVQTQRDRIARFLNDTDLLPDDVIPIVADVIGIEPTSELVDHLESPAAAALALAEVARHSTDPRASRLLARLVPLATQQHLPGNAHRLIGLGATPESIDTSSVSEMRASLMTLTQDVTSPNALHDEDTVPTWLDRCAVAARRDPTILPTVEGMLDGEGWYRCWLRFALALVETEAAVGDQAQRALKALRYLAGDLNPFAGKPRACDLYPIHGHIEETVCRAVAMLDDAAWPVALTILHEVTEGVGVSLRGQDAGPITPDFLLTLAIDATTTPSRRPATQMLIDKALVEGGGRRYYSTLAEYRLMAARFALDGGDRSQAENFWNEACRLMTAYGFHKDITIYEVLDPLPNLISADPAQARIRLAQVQATCERVVLHTDGKSTRSAWIQWWTFLAQADPAALTQLVVPALLKRSGRVYDLYNGALEDLWRSWHRLADPIIAGALRLALSMPLDKADLAMAEQLASITDGSGADLPGRLLTLLAARADERPLRHPYSNNDELIAEDNALVKSINIVAALANVPQICVFAATDENSDQHSARSARPPASSADIQQIAVSGFPDGAVGIARAIRTWRRRPYEPNTPDWAPERFANIIGYRLIELAEGGAEQDAEAALHTLAGALGLLDRSGLLTSLGEGLKRHGQNRLAATAFALAWTRTRGNDGWMNFGGETELDSLRHATQLDADTAWRTVASEVTRVVAGSHHGSRGVSQALIHASLAGGLTTHESPHAAAFAAWDEAHAVIALRTPRLADTDDPDEPYTAPPQSMTANPTGEINLVFSEAILGAMAHPGQENRQRALVALEIALRHHPETMATALAAALPALDDPALLSWLLAVVMAVEEAQPAVSNLCHEALQRHAKGPYLTVRALASRLLGDDAPPPPVAAPDTALLSTATLWTPGVNEPANEEAAGLVGAMAGHRLIAAEELLPNLSHAVIARVDTALADPERMKKLEREAQDLADRRHKRWADAFSGRRTLVEDALQRAASGGRSALLSDGRPPTDPRAWEYALAGVLLDDPSLCLAVECTRRPRPSLMAPPEARDPIWTRARAVAEPTSQHQGAADQDLVITVGAPSLDESCDTISAGRYRYWKIIASAEEHTILPIWPDRSDLLRQSGRDRALELRRPNDSAGLHSRPFAGDTTGNWFTHTPPLLGQVAPDRSLPLIGIDLHGGFLADTPYSLGMHSPLLVPTLLLMQVLRVQPSEEPFVLHDNSGPALAMITWRSHYETSDYHLPWKRARGTALMVSPEAFDRLVTWGQTNLVIREVVHGDSSFVSTADSTSRAT
ncbi:ATP-binding protein [Lentzea sp. BCCO 10_0856]|uniref:ATP-binding protein n=1 Tax=Lentzea miocenica TaxID=3095431 RepID=A0ABU4T0Q9_9PSEU|nr:ATP-binding protein [Lentzea sp. BCCO 10_0856]MDX8031741.1 ATP-binding protein [Lentzea sp. BCCO 10_0856]